MHSVRVVLLVAFCWVSVCAAVESLSRSNIAAQERLPLQPDERRTAVSDLEVRVAGQRPRFVTRAFLEKLPQAGAVVRQSEDFPEMPKDGVAVRGVDLVWLRRALGVTESMATEAVAADGYAATYPLDYTYEHRPIVVLSVGGLTPTAWAEKTHTSDLGPYFIAYDSFRPAFRVLAHVDRQQVPTQVVRLEFALAERMFATIGPWPWEEAQREENAQHDFDNPYFGPDQRKALQSNLESTAARDRPLIDGFKIAQQNCFRCHDANGYGGTKAGRSWAVLAKDASMRPEWFAKWVHDPQSIDPKSKMPGNPKYDSATLALLTRYFATIGFVMRVR